MSEAPAVAIFCAHTELVDIDKLVENPRNPNTHPESQIALLAKIIRAQGFRNAIVVSKRSGFVTKGHGRLSVAKSLPCNRVNRWKVFSPIARVRCSLVFWSI